MTHVREQIRNQAVTALTGLPNTGNNVFESQVYPLGEDQLPGLCVYTVSQESELSSLGMGSAPSMEHRLQLAIAAYVKDTSNYDSQIDSIMASVETALVSDSTLDGLTKFIYPTNLEINMTGEGDRPVIVATQTFEIIYRATLGVPDIAI